MCCVDDDGFGAGLRKQLERASRASRVSRSDNSHTVACIAGSHGHVGEVSMASNDESSRVYRGKVANIYNLDNDSSGPYPGLRVVSSNYGSKSGSYPSITSDASDLGYDDKVGYYGGRKAGEYRKPTSKAA